MGGGSKGGPNCEWVKDVKSKMPDFPDFPDFPFKFELPPMPALPGRVLPRGLLAASRPPADSGGIDLSELTAASISFGVGMLVVSLVGAVSLRRKGRLEMLHIEVARRLEEVDSSAAAQAVPTLSSSRQMSA